ncbi:MAG: flippase [Bacteroidales bacterium]|nr:flippase [Bacteroidales bacterium]
MIIIFIKYVKDKLYYYLSAFKHKGIKKYSKNTAWLIGDKITSMILGLLVGIWVARYLGPDKFGQLNYVFALVGLFAPISSLGLSGIISRDLVNSGTDTNTLLSTGFALKMSGSLLLFVMTMFYFFIFKNEPIYLQLAIVASLHYIFNSSEIIEYYYRARVRTKYIFISKLFGNVFSSILKVLFILMGLSVVYIGVARISLAFFTMIFLFYFFRKEDFNISLQYFKIEKGIELLKESWPLIFSGVFAIIYLQIDKIMIGEMLSSYEVGQYSVAARLSSLWFFIPLVIRQSVLPVFVNAKNQNEDIYYKRLNSMFSIMVFISYLIVIPFFLLSNKIIYVLYGSQYNEAGDVLAIHIFSLIFFFIGIGRGLWVVNESYFKFDLVNNIGAGILNIILNLLLLPKLGIIGAAYATLVSYSFTFFFGNLLFKPARRIFIMQARALLLMDLFKVKYNNPKNWDHWLS